MSRRQPQFVSNLAAVAVAMLMLSGCSDVEAEPPSADLASYLDFANREAQVTWTRSRFIAVEELVVVCMSNQGFEYRPEPFDERIVVTQPKTREEVAQFGVGYLAGFETQEVALNPNERLFDQMTEDERSAWTAALIEKDGCADQAWLEVNESWSEPSDLIREARQELAEKINADGRKIELDRRWSACMAGEGYDAASPERTVDLVEAELPSLESLQDVEFEELEQHRELERQIALAAFDCKEPLNDEYAQVRSEHEQDFINKHQAELIAIREEVTNLDFEG